MNQIVKICSKNDFERKLKELESASLLVLIAPSDSFEYCVEKMHECVPNVANIGVCGQGYNELKDYPTDIILIAYKECQVVVDVIKDVKKPIYSIKKLDDNVRKIQPGKDNTICLDFTTGNDSVIVTSLNVCLEEKGIELVGATAWDNKVSCNGVLYNDACVYALIKNNSGKIFTYKENIYEIDDSMPKFVATKVNEDEQKIIELDGKRASAVYQNILGIRDSDIETQTFKNPIGRIVGDETYIISIKSRCTDGSLECYKRSNSMDTLTVLQLGDYKNINIDTVNKIKQELPGLKGVFTVNCILRYIMFNDNHYMSEYLKTMNNLGNHVGLVGCGEHYRSQHVNQTMTCFAFN